MKNILKYHKNYDYYIEFLSEQFPRIPKVEIILRNFDIICAIVDNDNSACVEEISYEVNISEQRIRVKLRELENEKIITSKREKKPNTSYNKKYYSTYLDKEFTDKFKKYLKCSYCGDYIGKFGGIVHINIERSVRTAKIFCSKECRNRWCYSV